MAVFRPGAPFDPENCGRYSTRSFPFLCTRLLSFARMPAATRLEPFGLEQFDPELTAEGLMAERLVESLAGGGLHYIK